MSFFGKWNSVLLAAAFLVAAAGCSPMDQGSMDEEKEPHYVLGKSRVNAMNYTGAIEAFEESLEADPHSAQAHYQLAMLYENQESDPAAAIYHYQQYLKYDPGTENAEIINQHIASCKQQLASDVLQLPSAPAAQHQLENLTEENRRLHDQLSQWQAYYAAQQAAAKTNPPTPQLNYSAPPQGAQPQNTSQTPDDTTSQSATVTAISSRTLGTTSSSHRTASPPSSARTRTHTVSAGETLASIARKQGISLASLESANPAVNPRKLKAGQVLNLPAP
ncbi:MAG TPA: LysM peptidoglycan-binding domain-containing protein [Verrucomicrobiae bacterium]|jgi:LysM repeat protein|nr:LysM peptidoglycan-binding domain-containing protein [Verrucomicrobiae bacterium]